MDGEEDLDTHMCLSCQMPIIGLDNYVYHKKFSCPAKKTTKPSGSNSVTVTQQFSGAVTLPPDSGLITTTSSVSQSHQQQQDPRSLQIFGNVSDVTSTTNMTIDTSTFSGTPSRFSAVDPNMVLCSTNHSQVAVSVQPSLTAAPAHTIHVSSNTSHGSTLSLPGSIHTLHGPNHTIPEPTYTLSTLSHSELITTETLSGVPLQQDSSTSNLSGATPSIIDFLSSLELQCRSTTKQSEDRGLDDPRSLESRVPDGLKFAALLNDLNFDSDSEGFDMPSDAEDLLNFDDEDYQELNGPSYSGKEGKGKGRPLGKLEAAKGGKKGRHTFIGKWKPGDRPHTGGKGMNLRPLSIGKRHYEEMSSDEDLDGFEQEDEAQETFPSSNQAKSVKGGQQKEGESQGDPEDGITDDHTYVLDEDIKTTQEYKCEPCDKIFSTRHALHNHVRSSKHCHLASLPEEQRSAISLQTDPKPKQKVSYSVECSTCQKSFNNKYNYARHLMSSLHLKRSNSSFINLDPHFQKLLLRLKHFQCRVCEFFCNSGDDLMRHLLSEDHKDKAKVLIGPMCCVRCKFATRCNYEIFKHFTSEQHLQSVKESDRPCVLREIRANLICSICDKRFHSATALKRHLRSQHPNDVGQAVSARGSKKCKSSLCIICNKDCKTKYNMMVHMRRHHTGEKPYSCDVCNKRFMEQSTLNMHYKSQKHLDNVIRISTISSPSKDQSQGLAGTNNKARAYKCRLCKFYTTEYIDLRPHFIEAHGQMHVCQICGLNFLKEAALAKHLETDKHKKMEQEAAGNAALSCGQCGHKFYSKEKLSLHLLSHSTKDTIPKAKKILLGVPEKFHKFVLTLPKKSGISVQCPECKQFLKSNNIVPHLRSHGDPGQLPFKCNFCAKSFTSNSTLYRHHQGHLGIKPFECSICNRRFRTTPELASHELKAHRGQTDIKPEFQCNMCGMEFIQSSKFRVHMRFHESDRRFKCEFKDCTRSFVLLSSLKDHERVHTGEKPYLCDLCGFATKTNTHMKRHRRVHTGECNYQCEYCTFKASHSWGLRRHMRIHIGCKPYKCPYCDYRCNCHTNLRHHVLSNKRHAGLTVYKCKMCDMGTNHAKEFQKHMIEAHSVPAEEVENICVYAGIYIKDSDTRSIPEGSQVYPVREKKTRTKKKGNLKKEDTPSSHQLETNVGVQSTALMVEPDSMNNMANLYNYTNNQSRLLNSNHGHHIYTSSHNNSTMVSSHSAEHALTSTSDIQPYLIIQPTPEINSAGSGHLQDQVKPPVVIEYM